MSFQFVKGPQLTSKSREQVAAIIKEVGDERRFMGMFNRTAIRQAVNAGKATYGAFSPEASDDPFASASSDPADWRVGWQKGHAMTSRVMGTNMHMSREFGWTVIFEFRNSGSVTATVQGLSERKEVEKFVQQVFDLL